MSNISGKNTSHRLEVIAGNRKSVYQPDITKRLKSSSNYTNCSWREQVLRRCKQSDIIKFNQFYPNSVYKKCKKIGEGTYAEVYLNTQYKSVMKIIPVEGEIEINGEVQKTYEQILPEIVISMELHNLNSNKKNQTSGFVGVKSVNFIKY